MLAADNVYYYTQGAVADLKLVLLLEPNNKKATAMLKRVKKDNKDHNEVTCNKYHDDVQQCLEDIVNSM
jgi:hypothetical protein